MYMCTIQEYCAVTKFVLSGNSGPDAIAACIAAKSGRSVVAKTHNSSLDTVAASIAAIIAAINAVKIIVVAVDTAVTKADNSGCDTIVPVVIAKTIADIAKATADTAEATADTAEATADTDEATADTAEATVDTAEATVDAAKAVQAGANIAEAAAEATIKSFAVDEATEAGEARVAVIGSETAEAIAEPSEATAMTVEASAEA